MTEFKVGDKVTVATRRFGPWQHGKEGVVDRILQGDEEYDIAVRIISGLDRGCYHYKHNDLASTNPYREEKEKDWV